MFLKPEELISTFGRSVKINRLGNTPGTFQNSQFSEDLFTCTNEYPNGELHFLCGVLVVL